MKNIFIGLLFVFLDFNLNLGASTVELIPDFIGFILMYNGSKELIQESEWFNKIMPFTLGMSIYSGVIYALDLLGLSAGLDLAFSFILGVITLIMTIYINYAIVMGVSDMEIRYDSDFNWKPLYAAWKLLAICQVLIYLLVFIPIFNIIGLLVVLIANIYYLYCFSKTKNLYYNSI